MMNDAFRNQAYERAIQAAVTPGTHVLDIGTGSGLLSLMAARAGARRVTTCEMVKVVAEKARDIVARNGYENKITVVPLKSTDARRGHEIDGRADLLVSEILSSDLLGEGVLPALEHARTELLTPEAKIIPAACGVMGFLGGAEELESRNHVAEVAGFDLSPFNESRPCGFLCAAKTTHTTDIRMISRRWFSISSRPNVFRPRTRFYAPRDPDRPLPRRGPVDQVLARRKYNFRKPPRLAQPQLWLVANVPRFPRTNRFTRRPNRTPPRRARPH